MRQMGILTQDETADGISFCSVENIPASGMEGPAVTDVCETLAISTADLRLRVWVYTRLCEPMSVCKLACIAFFHSTRLLNSVICVVIGR